MVKSIGGMWFERCIEVVLSVVRGFTVDPLQLFGACTILCMATPHCSLGVYTERGVMSASAVKCLLFGEIGMYM